MDQSTLKPAAGSKHSKKRVGRGHGTGQGTQAGRGHIKVLARGDISKKLTVRAHKFSGKAAEKIAAAGGAAEVLGAQ